MASEGTLTLRATAKSCVKRQQTVKAQEPDRVAHAVILVLGSGGDRRVRSSRSSSATQGALGQLDHMTLGETGGPALFAIPKTPGRAVQATVPSSGCVCVPDSVANKIVAVTLQGRHKSRPCGFPAKSAERGLSVGSCLAPCLGNRRGRGGTPGMAVGLAGQLGL